MSLRDTLHKAIDKTADLADAVSTTAKASKPGRKTTSGLRKARQLTAAGLTAAARKLDS